MDQPLRSATSPAVLSFTAGGFLCRFKGWLLEVKVNREHCIYPWENEHGDCWKITIFNMRYIFKWLELSIVMFFFPGCFVTSDATEEVISNGGSVVESSHGGG